MSPTRPDPRPIALPATLKTALGERTLGGMKFNTYVKRALEEGSSDDPRAVKLATQKYRALVGALDTVANRLHADLEDLHIEQDLKLAEWEAEGSPDDKRPDADVDTLKQEIGVKEQQLADLTKVTDAARSQLEALLDRLTSASFVGVSEPSKVADKLRQSAVLQAEKFLHRVADLDDAARHAQIVTAQAATASVIDPLGAPGKPMRLQMKRANIPDTPDTPLWLKIRRATIDLSWDSYLRFMEGVLCRDSRGGPADSEALKKVNDSRIALPFPDVDAYRFLKAATEVFMMVHCDTWNGVFPAAETLGEEDDDLEYAERRLGRTYTVEEITDAWAAYLQPADTTGSAPRVLPYLALIRAKLQDASLIEWPEGKDAPKAIAACSGILRRKLASPCLLELIWSYWHEEGMLVQTMNAITRRFQNIRTPGDRDPLAALEIDPLRPLNNLLWGYIQDEQHRLSIVRRAYEYDHHYGLALVGKAVPGLKGADSRARFLEGFHNLLHLCTIFFKEDDDTTVIADGFPVLNALRDVHILLSQGAHNQYGDLPWTARQEMLMQEWLLSRAEMREFLPTRIMVAYPEPWMDRVDAMKSLMAWTDTSVLHFRELGVYGERILLGARFNDWTRVIEPERAANWARFWRPEIQGYIHAYRAATGVDLTERTESTMPSALLRSRLAGQRAGAR